MTPLLLSQKRLLWSQPFCFGHVTYSIGLSIVGIGSFFNAPLLLFCVCLFVFSSVVACCNFHIIIHHIQLIYWLIWIKIQDIFNWLVCFVRHSDDAICKISYHTVFVLLFFSSSYFCHARHRKIIVKLQIIHLIDYFESLDSHVISFHFRGFLTHISASGDDPFSIKRGREHVIFLASCAIGWKSSAESWWRRTARLLTRSGYGYCFDWWLTFIQLLWTVRCVIFLLDKVKALFTPTLSKWVFKIVRFWMRSQFSVDKLQESASFFVRTSWNQLILGVYSCCWLVTVGITFSSVSRLTLCVSTHFSCKLVNQIRDGQLLQCL